MKRLAGGGWLVLVGGGEFTFGETVDADRAWMSKVADGTIGFLPTASGSTEYGDFFEGYIREGFDRRVEVVPIYRNRDARRGRNLERIEATAALYVGGGVADHLLDTLTDEPAIETLGRYLGQGKVVVAIAAAAQAFGVATRSIFGGETIPGFGWLPGGVVETNFDPAHDRRLRELMGAPGVRWGLGLPAGSAVLLGPEGTVETVGPIFTLDGPDADFEIIGLAPTEGAEAEATDDSTDTQPPAHDAAQERSDP